MPGKEEQPLYVVRLEVASGVAATVETRLDFMNWPWISWHASEKDRVLFEQFHSVADDAAAARERIARCAREWFGTSGWHVDLEQMAAQDWRESWKSFFHAEKVSPRLWVKPSWEPCDVPDGCHVIEIDPGLSFGTGQHATTRSCLKLLDRNAESWEGMTLLDVGCGSGILSIAAARLGFGRVTAWDHDARAVETCRQNVEKNGVSRRVTCRVADLADVPRTPQYDVTVANIFADVLTAYAEALRGTLRRRGSSMLILSGILSPQYAGVKVRYEALGLREHTALVDGEWTTGSFVFARPRG